MASRESDLGASITGRVAQLRRPSVSDVRRTRRRTPVATLNEPALALDVDLLELRDDHGGQPVALDVRLDQDVSLSLVP